MTKLEKHIVRTNKIFTGLELTYEKLIEFKKQKKQTTSSDARK